VVCGGGQGFDFVEGLEQGVRKSVAALQDLGEGVKIVVVVGARVREGVLVGQQVGEPAEELAQQRAADAADERGVGEEVEGGGGGTGCRLRVAGCRLGQAWASPMVSPGLTGGDAGGALNSFGMFSPARLASVFIVFGVFGFQRSSGTWTIAVQVKLCFLGIF
jgi:hypothetical protein